MTLTYELDLHNGQDEPPC